MKFTNKTMGLTALAVLASAGQAFAVAFSGSSAGTFENAIGDAGLVTTGLGTSSFTWGANDASVGVPPPPNSLDFAGAQFSEIECDEVFSIGTVRYYNGTTLLGTNADSVDLAVAITFTSPAGALVSLNYVLQLITTPNVPVLTDDYISLPDVPSETFIIAGQKYRLDLSFDGEQEFYVPENESALANLNGQIACLPVPESGSSLALLGGGMLLVSGVRRKLKAVK